jgi:murein L,D-transpeptidase YcbB/YkuD
MRTLTLSVVAAAVVTLTACASPDYQQYAKTQQQIAQSRAAAEQARYMALAEIARSGDTTAKVAAVIALQQGAPQQSSNSPKVSAPTGAGDTALKWASVLVPSLTQVYGIGKNAEVAIVNSNNALQGKVSDNDMVTNLVIGREPIIGTQDDVLLFPQ